MTAALEQANAAQRAASDPAVSAFVSASAGSGKTKLLTDRLLRLMLAGTPPGRILCLTYTKAAAAEMAIRLNQRLGKWVALPEEALKSELAALDVATEPKILARARQLFADVLDLPGGMRISTIHAFCQSLLRRFPLEAGLSPHFELAEDSEAAARLREAREAVLADPAHRQAILALAAETDEQSFATVTARISDGGHDLVGLLRQYGAAGLTAMQRAALDAGEHAHDDVMRQAVNWEREHHVAASWRRIAEAGNPSGKKKAVSNLEWLAHETEMRFLNWVGWIDGHFTKDRKPATFSGFYGDALVAERDALHQELVAEQQRIEIIEEKRRAIKLCEINAELLKLIIPILDAEGAARQLAASLSYADLINFTGQLLIDPGAAWILYKLDGGIDHLLLDEVQDTAPAQWEIADALAKEFFSGDSAREVKRSIFAVGDVKQSIFSFQGADLQSFQKYRQLFRERVTRAGERWLDGALAVSFRSTAAVLNLVDAVFAEGTARAGVCAPGDVLQHGVSRIGQAGAVSLWPLRLPLAAPDLPDWDVPDDYAAAESAKAALARDIALHIEKMLLEQRYLPSRARAVAPGDILILVRHRDELVTAITAECKARQVPIAGLDRMELTQQQAVSDLLALCDALLLPEDDLAFAQFLASPLGGLSDESLMKLALGRRGRLAAALHARRDEQEDWRAAQIFFETLRNRAGYVTPHALLAEALGPLGGRAKFLRRLGAEAAEPIDELLAEAINHAKRAPSSLQIFIHELRQSGATIKREADAGGDVVRIMTVHGAKGLQAPIVILPDTAGVPKNSETLYWLHPPEQETLAVPVFCPRAELRSDTIAAAQEDAKTAQTEEQNRLLYVALTRAEDELIVCGAQGRKALPETCWYNLVKPGFERLGAQADEMGNLVFAMPQSAAPDREVLQTTATIHALPGWAGRAPDWSATPPAAETARPEPLAPSRATDGDRKRAIATSPLNMAGTTPGAREAALAKGRLIHALLQHLPDLPPAHRRDAAQDYLAAQTELDAPAQEETLATVMTVLESPLLAPLFGAASRAEAPLAGVVGDIEIGGVVDRLAITPDQVLFADYKTDRNPPDTAETVPPAYLRQLAAYAAILAQIYPDRAVSCLLVFTETGAVLPVPGPHLARHAPALPLPFAS